MLAHAKAKDEARPRLAYHHNGYNLVSDGAILIARQGEPEFGPAPEAVRAVIDAPLSLPVWVDSRALIKWAGAPLRRQPPGFWRPDCCSPVCHEGCESHLLTWSRPRDGYLLGSIVDREYVALAMTLERGVAVQVYPGVNIGRGPIRIEGSNWLAIIMPMAPRAQSFAPRFEAANV